ncbi:MAG: SLC13 family permease [Acidimicrobiales bacterium]
MLRTAGWAALVGGLPALAVAAALAPHRLGAAASVDWPPFVLVAGLLALGLVARDDGLFDAAGAAVARSARGGRTLFACGAVLVAVVTAVLNLDTAVVFLTPVLVLAARRRGTDEAPFLYLAVFLCNAASLLLPGSNLTNLIVLGSLGQSGSTFAAAMVLPWLAAVAGVTVVVAVVWHRALGRSGERSTERPHVTVGAGALGVVVVVAAMLALPPAGEAGVAIAVGAATVAWSMWRRRLTVGELRRTVNLPVLAGLFVVAIDFGTLGRVWAGPAHLLHHSSLVVTAVVGAVASVVVNNLPAASLLAARPVSAAHALLVGLDLGPNLAVSGALSAVLWLQVSHSVGARPSARRYSALGLAVVPVSMTAALSVLAAVR